MSRLAKMMAKACAIAGLLLVQSHTLVPAAETSIEDGFKNPPDSAKPRTWWHWTAGNVTKEGITRDLEWMKRVGIGGFQLADVASGSGQTVEKKILLTQPLTESGLLGPVTFVAQVQPQPQADENARPAPTQSGQQRGPRRGAISRSPREQVPFTNENFDKVNPNLPTLIIAGDSTAAQNQDPDHRGWGAVLVDYFDTDKVNVINRAIAGRSFRTYFGENRWQDVVDHLKPGDFVVIEFGHNDGGGANSANGRGDVPGTGDETQEVTRRNGTKETVHTYGWYCRKFIQDARAKGATSIVSSTTVRNNWKDGKVERGLGQMPVWAHKVADEQKTLFLDHSNITADLYEKMGQEAVGKYFPADPTHTSTDGAVTNAEMLIAGLKALPALPLVEFLNEKGKRIEAYHPPHRQ